MILSHHFLILINFPVSFRTSTNNLYTTDNSNLVCMMCMRDQIDAIIDA